METVGKIHANTCTYIAKLIQKIIFVAKIVKETVGVDYEWIANEAIRYEYHKLKTMIDHNNV